MSRTIPFKINNKNIIVEKSERYISENEIKEVIEDLINNNLEMPQDKFIDLSNICNAMFSIMYKGIITTIENINNIEISIDNIVFQVC